MTNAVFIHPSDSIYEDIPSGQYQFPKQYLNRVKECVGDWIVYYEPSKVPEQPCGNTRLVSKPDLYLPRSNLIPNTPSFDPSCSSEVQDARALPSFSGVADGCNWLSGIVRLT